jgi:hypothetical protein
VTTMSTTHANPTTPPRTRTQPMADGRRADTARRRQRVLTALDRRCCVVRSGGSLNLFPWSDQIAWVSSVKAARTRKFSGSSIPSS